MTTDRMKKEFKVVSISRQDIVDAGLNGESVDEKKMKALADFMLGFMFCDESFDSAIHSFAEHYGIKTLEI